MGITSGPGAPFPATAHRIPTAQWPATDRCGMASRGVAVPAMLAGLTKPLPEGARRAASIRGSPRRPPQNTEGEGRGWRGGVRTPQMAGAKAGATTAQRRAPPQRKGGRHHSAKAGATTAQRRAPPQRKGGRHHAQRRAPPQRKGGRRHSAKAGATTAQRRAPPQRKGGRHHSAEAGATTAQRRAPPRAKAGAT
eukprot:gene10812-biopygen5979